MIHPKSEVQSNHIGEGTVVWQFSIILQKAKLGNNCNINCHVFIENDVIIGNNVTIKSGVQIWDGIKIEDNVFVGPNVTFVNDERPRSKKYPQKFQQTLIKKSASIGAGAVILGGVTIGEYSMIGAGSVVTKSVPERALVVGNPGRIVGWLNKDGSKMHRENENIWTDINGKLWKVVDNKIINI